MVKLTDFLAFKDSVLDKKYNCVRCCLSDVGCDQLYDEVRDIEPCVSIYLQLNKCSKEEALNNTGYLIFRF